MAKAQNCFGTTSHSLSNSWHVHDVHIYTGYGWWCLQPQSGRNHPRTQGPHHAPPTISLHTEVQPSTLIKQAHRERTGTSSSKTSAQRIKIPYEIINNALRESWKNGDPAKKNTFARNEWRWIDTTHNKGGKWGQDILPSLAAMVARRFYFDQMFDLLSIRWYYATLWKCNSDYLIYLVLCRGTHNTVKMISVDIALLKYRRDFCCCPDEMLSWPGNHTNSLINLP